MLRFSGAAISLLWCALFRTTHTPFIAHAQIVCSLFASHVAGSCPKMKVSSSSRSILCMAYLCSMCIECYNLICASFLSLRQLNVAFPATGCQKLIEIEDEHKV